MAMDEKLKWLETRINSSLRPRNEDLKNMFMNDENRLAFHEFINNEDVRRLFVYTRPSRQIVASLQPPHDLKTKSVFFLKNNVGVKLNKDNMDDEVMYMDCVEDSLKQMDIVTREVFLPLLCVDTMHATEYGISTDKLMDILHRLMATVEVTEGHTQGEIILPLPSIEVLAEAAANVNRRGAVLHVLESTVIGWIKQIRGLLKHDPIADLARQSGDYPGPLDEIQLWNTRLQKLHSINAQLDSPVAVDILRNLEEANSTYAHSFQHVRKEINKAIQDTEENMKFLSTMEKLFYELHHCLDPHTMLKLFPPLIHTVLLVWTYSKYYHQADKFHNLLRLISNEVVHRAEAMVGEDVLREPLQSYSTLKEALRVCAAFRGTYLDYRDKAEEINERNKQDHAEKMITRPQGPHMLFSTKMYGPHAYTPRYGLKSRGSIDGSDTSGEEELSTDSPWPPRNAPAFDLLNAFMERCNDVLELVQTTRHFRLLADAAEVGGAGSQSLDALVKEIHLKYTRAMGDFFSKVTNVLSIDGTQAFERAFFTFRTVVKDLEARLSEVLRQSFVQCPTIGAQLRLLEVFEGISGRELVQLHLKDKDHALVKAFTDELVQVRAMYQSKMKRPPVHKNMPPVVSKLMWVHALKTRVVTPMEKMKTISPHSLEGDLGWQLRDAYADAVSDFEKYETKITTDWQNNITAELTARLRQPLLVAEDYDEDEDLRPQIVHVNLDPRLLMLLREIHYLSQEPFNIKLPGPARELLRNTNSQELRVTATRLETITSKYNTVMKSITEYELPLFERKLSKIDQLFDDGLKVYTWKTEESADFIEMATALVCLDVHYNLDIVQTNCNDIAQVTLSWSRGTLDIFAARDATRSYSIHELTEIQDTLDEELEIMVVPSGTRIHCVLKNSFEAVQISEASPAWQDYVDYVDAIVLDGLKQACLTSLKSMLNQIVKCNMSQNDVIPILTIRLELLENNVAFRPPLDESSSQTSVQEVVQRWLGQYLARGKLVPMLGGDKGSYKDYIEVDEEVQQLVMHITKLVQENGEECKNLFDLFKDYSFLWLQDVNSTFQEFLRGKLSPNPMRSASKSTHADGAGQLRLLASARSNSRASSAKSSVESAGLMGTAERTFLTPKQSREAQTNVPSLDEFDAEIDIYRTARDEICALQDYQDVGWLRVDLKPIKQVLTTYASKWMWTFTKYLSDQVTNMLENLDDFLKRIEPEIESITGEERDTASFMKMMRLFNEVSAQQAEMDGKFAAMHRTVLLVKKYGQKLPENTQRLFDAAPGRWNNLKTKVSLAKQRLGPRIQEESERITRDLAAFGERVIAFHRELDRSEIYNRECSIGDAWVTIDNFVKRLTVLESEAQDLIELQELLEASVVNFSLLPQCRHDLTNLKQVWETVRVIDEQQTEWKRHRWQKMNTRFLREETGKQLDIVRTLPEDVFTWDVYMGLHESITTIQACLPLIDDLSNPAMRTRHWKQLVRVSGGALQIDNDTLKRMTLGELLGLGLQKHVDDVRAIVQRAVKDLSIEQSLKTYEEVWLSKVFEMREHVRNKATMANVNASKDDGTADNQSEVSQSEGQSQHQSTLASRSQLRTTSRISNQSNHSRNRRTSAASLPISLLQLGEDTGLLYLLTSTEPIFEELENHQVTLQAMQSNSAAGSFLDEVLKWQKRLQTIEAVLTTWLEVQDKWVELEEVFHGTDVKTALSHDANIFALVNADFRLLMRATEKNPNVLQCCQRKNILTILEKMNTNLDHCRKSLLIHLERRRQKFSRFYFLSMEDVLHIVCNGYDLKQVNLYINKLFENIGSLVYDEVEDNDKYNFQIVGVQSTLGEKLPFKEPVKCEGQIENWLSSFVQSMKTALQYQLATAVGLERPRTREIHSAGARRVTVTDRKHSANKSAKEKSVTGSHSGSRVGSRQQSRQGEGSAPPSASQTKVKEDSHSWTLDHVTEIVYLVTQIQMTKQVGETLQELDGGNAEAIQTAIFRLNESLKASVVMLKGLEDEKETRARMDKEKAESEAQSQRDKKESETMSETTSVRGGGRNSMAASHKGSMMDITIDNQQPPIPEESSSKQDDAASVLEPSTAEPQDTMTLSALPIVTKKEEVVEEEEINTADLKLMLFPSQIQKISSLIALLAHQRELLQRLQESHDNNSTKLADSFMWQSQLQYTFNEENRVIQVKCLENEFEYGFEYQGSSAREVITPMTEKVFFSLTQAVQAHMGGLCMGPAGNGQLTVVHELSRSLGRALYTFNCTQAVDSYMLHDIMKGLATTGCWVCFNAINNIKPEVLSVCAQLLTTILDALRAGKTSVSLQSEDMQLSPQVACFALIDGGIRVSPGNPEKLLLFNSAVSRLPSDLLSQFRTVSLVTPDIKLMIEVLLTSQGFFRARELAHKTVQLYEMCRDLLGTNAPITADTSHLTYDSSDHSHGWSVQTLKYVTLEAGALLDRIVCNKLQEQEDADNFEEEEEEDDEQEKQEAEQQEKGPVVTDQDSLSNHENEALVIALRNTYMPRLKDRDASVFGQLLNDLWPDVEVPLTFGDGRFTPESEIMDEKSTLGSKGGSKPGSRNQVKSQMESYQRSYRDSLALNTPVVPLSSVLGDRLGMDGDSEDKQVLEDINDAIAVATGKLGLMPGSAFQARVSQLAELNIAHRTVIVAGPPGCGKSECIKTYALAERERGKTINVQSVFTKAVESHELLGYVDPITKQWRDGLATILLRKFCIQQASINYDVNAKPPMKILQLDGDMDLHQMELMNSILHNDGSVVLANNERIILPDTLRFMWEVESLSSMSPSLLANVGVLCMSLEDVGWQLMLAQWVERRPESDRDLLHSFCDIYIQPIITYLSDCTRPPMLRKRGPQVTYYKRVVWQAEESMVNTFCTLMDALVNQYPDLSDIEYERYFNFAAIWSFGGTLDIQHRESFSTWWKQTFEKYIDYPDYGTVFDYMVDSESHEFVRWADVVPAYSGTPHEGIPAEAFVHSINVEQILYLLGVLSDFGKPVMLVGESGCGKSSIVNERIRTVCSGEVAEVLALTVNCNRFSNARLLYQRLDERLEWKHGHTYVPKGNKRLMCLVDDLNLAQVDQFHNQTAVELVRQHIDDGGFYDLDNFSWRYVKNVTYVTTVNPNPTAHVPKLNSRLLRHFAIFGVPYPGPTELQTIFTTLLHTHFITPEMTSAVTISASTAHHLGIHDEKVKNVIRDEEENLKRLLALMVKVTLELQDRLRTMFLPTAQRCHYIFNMRDLSNIFRNLCLSLQPGCNRDSCLLLWEHECHWVYGCRMVNEVDSDRYRHAFITAVRKEFSNEDHIQLLSNSKKPIFSNLMEQDSGIVTAGNIMGTSSSSMSDDDGKTDLYKPVFSVKKVRDLLEHGVEEYNKIHPRIKLALYRPVIEEVCRLARVIASPHEVAHCVLVAEGCPGRCTTIANLAAHLCGYMVYKINPSPVSNVSKYDMDSFKADLVAAYTRAGVRGEKILFMLNEEELVEEDFLVYLTEFIVAGSISHLFTYEETTTIINSIRTEVTQAGLTYTREVAWDFFLRTVKKNFRVCLIDSGGATKFQNRCREYPQFSSNINFLWFPHWTKKHLIKHSLLLLKDVPWMDKVQRENIGHLLATMHIVIRQQDGQEANTGQYCHLTNTAFEKFVERFITMANERHRDIHAVHQMLDLVMVQVMKENAMATKLKKQLEHEKIVLEERKAGTIRILSQIGQDTAITEQQIKIVKAQMEKIQRLKKLLPEYQVAHERAVFKAIAIVADTKKVVQSMDIDSLSELRAMQKPIIDIEDLMAAIIMILKNPSADLTWQKGAKRQMANLERFIEELMSFDDNILPESTLNLVEPYLKKPSFDPETIERKTSNAACGSLCRWVRGVCRYHRMMISKVKPLHSKVDQTMQAVDNAEHKMSTLENKRKALEVRLADLAKGFEEATIDKNEQEEKTIKMDKMLQTAGRLRKTMKKEQIKIQQVLDSLPHRMAALPGGCAMAAAFTTYLGPYYYNFRRLMLTVHWPNCLRERGVPLVIDSIDDLRGRVVDWSIEGLQTASGATGDAAPIDWETEYESEEEQPVDQEEEEEEEELTNEDSPEEEGSERKEGEEEKQEEEETEKGEKEEPETTDKEKEAEAGEAAEGEDKPAQPEQPPPQDGLEQIVEDDEEEEEEDEYTETESGSARGYSGTGTLPMISSNEFNQYVRSLVKLLVGESTMNDWIKKDFGPRQMENAAILWSSWQRPPMLIDPYGEGTKFLSLLNRQKLHKKKLICLDMDTKSDSQVIMSIEKAIMRGHPVLLENCEEQIDSMVAPIIDHRNSAYENDQEDEPRMIKYCGRRILCHTDFRLYMATNNPKPKLSSAVASSTTLLNYGVSNETLVDDLLNRAFARVRPELYKERRLALKCIHTDKHALIEFRKFLRSLIDSAVMGSWHEREVEAIGDAMKKGIMMGRRIQDTQILLQNLDSLREELFPLARRGTMLCSLLGSLAAVQWEYQFTMPYFLQLFDEAIGEAFPAEYLEDSDAEEDDEDDESSDTDHKDNRPTSATSQKSQTDQAIEDQEAEKVTKDEENTEVQKEISKDGDESAEVDPSDITKEEEEPIHVKEIPEAPELPTEGVDYNSMSVNQIKQMVDALTANVFKKVRQSLYEEHRLLFAALLCINIQEEQGEHFSEEEMSLLLQGNPGLGMQLSLKDFDCQDEPPAWMPEDKWEDILALSVLPGPLDSICVHMAQNTDEWKMWYRSEQPENEPLPFKPTESEETNKQEEEEGQTVSPDLGPLTDFHQLLILRMLRPDRLPSALSRYVSKHLSLNLEKQTALNLQDVLDNVNNSHTGVLVLLPPSPVYSDEHPVSTLKMSEHPGQVIASFAQNVGFDVEVVSYGEGREVNIIDAIDTAERENSWVVIEGLHLAPSSFYRELKYHLQRLLKGREALPDDKRKESKVCIWLTSEPCDRLPADLIQSMYKLAWDAVHPILNGMTGGKEGQEAVFPHGSLTDALATAISAAFKSVPSTCWDKVREGSQSVKAAVYGTGIVHGILTVRQMFGTRGLSQWYPFSQVQMCQTIDALTGPGLNAEGKEATAADICAIVAEGIYCNMVCNRWDQRYVQSIVNSIVGSLVENQSETVTVGHLQLPTPPANVDPSEFGQWFEEKVSEEGVSTVEGLCLHGNVDREWNDAHALQFVDELERIYVAHNKDLGDISVRKPKEIDIYRLRAILDSVLEQLPPLLELGNPPAGTAMEEYDFPYHRPSVLSMATAESLLMPESIGYVLLQECLWMNSLLCHIRQDMYNLHNSLLGGVDAFPKDLTFVVRSLIDEHVPPSWVHPNCQPSTHSLVSWQDDLKKRHQQMHGWVKHHMVPLFNDKSGPISHGRLRSVWLGGLVNPQALFTALRQEKAVITEKLIDEITLTCEVSRSFDDEDGLDQDNEAGIFVKDLYLQGAAWDVDSNCLAETLSDVTPMPCVSVTAVLRSDLEQAKAAEDEGEASPEVKYECPLYMNKARQVCPLTLPIRSTVPVDKWVMAGVGLVLDIGVPEDTSKKSRSFVTMKALAPPLPPLTAESSATTQQASRQDESAQGDGILHDIKEEDEEEEVVPVQQHQQQQQQQQQAREEEEEGGSTNRSDNTHRSSQSQLSYKAMSPQAPPLPPELQMTRERPMLKDANKNDEQHASKESVVSQRSQVSRTSQRSQRSQRSQVSRKSQQGHISPNLQKAKSPSKESVAKQSQHGSNQASSHVSLGLATAEETNLGTQKYASEESVSKQPEQESQAPFGEQNEQIEQTEFRATPVQRTESKASLAQQPESHVSPVPQTESRVSPVQKSESKASLVQDSEPRASPVQQAESPVQQAESPVQQAQSPVQQAQSPVQQAESPVPQAQSPVQQTESPVQQIESRASPVQPTESKASDIQQAESQASLVQHSDEPTPRRDPEGMETPANEKEEKRADPNY